jgi:hypothetical protein
MACHRVGPDAAIQPVRHPFFGKLLLYAVKQAGTHGAAAAVHDQDTPAAVFFNKRGGVVLRASSKYDFRRGVKSKLLHFLALSSALLLTVR